MKYLLCILISYVIGAINPSYIIAKIRGFDIRKKGSKNAGASNALILFGKTVGIACAIFDVAKAFFAVWLCSALFPGLSWLFPISGISCIFGHIFPFYMRFRGGKGLACLGGVVLVYDWRVFLIMMVCEVFVVLVTSYICFVPLTASLVFPAVYGIMDSDLIGALIFCLMIPVMFFRHKENFVRIKNGEEMRISALWNKDKEFERMNIPKE